MNYVAFIDPKDMLWFDLWDEMNRASAVWEIE